MSSSFCAALPKWGAASPTRSSCATGSAGYGMCQGRARHLRGSRGDTRNLVEGLQPDRGVDLAVPFRDDAAWMQAVSGRFTSDIQCVVHVIDKERSRIQASAALGLRGWTG